MIMDNPRRCHDEDAHRRAFMVFTQESFKDLLMMGSTDPSRYFQIITDLPPDAKLVAVHYDYVRQGFAMVFEHESFDRVPEGCMLPMLPAATIQCITVEDDDD